MSPSHDSFYTPTLEQELQYHTDTADFVPGNSRRPSTTITASNCKARRQSTFDHRDPEIALRRARRPSIARACGHLEPTATVAIPGVGEDTPALLEQAENGCYILVGPQSRADEWAGSATDQNESRDIVPALCSHCESHLSRPTYLHARDPPTDTSAAARESACLEDYNPPVHAARTRSTRRSEQAPSLGSDTTACGGLRLHHPRSICGAVSPSAASQRRRTSCTPPPPPHEGDYADILRDIDAIMAEHSHSLMSVISDLNAAHDRLQGGWSRRRQQEQSGRE